MLAENMEIVAYLFPMPVLVAHCQFLLCNVCICELINMRPRQHPQMAEVQQ